MVLQNIGTANYRYCRAQVLYSTGTANYRYCRAQVQKITGTAEHMHRKLQVQQSTVMQSAVAYFVGVEQNCANDNRKLQ